MLERDPNAPIPIAISGFTGEAAAALRLDLWTIGCAETNESEARFLVTGSNNGRLEGRLIYAPGKQQLLGKAYAGSNARLLAHAFADDIAQVFKRKGIAQTKIAFKVSAGKTSEIYVADYDGHNAVQLTRDNDIVAAPAWAAPRMLLYTSYRLGDPHIYSHDLNTGARAIMSRYSGLNTSAAVSPDGRRVAMILSKGGSPDVYVANVDGSDLVQLTKTREPESSPCWSPDGMTICFSSTAEGRSALYTVRASGGQMLKLRTAGVPNATEPDWSPDGKNIIFTSQMGSFQICIVPAGGGNATTLVEGEDPSWAPNSRTVIFARRDRKVNRTLSLLDVPTKRVKDVKNVPGSVSQPAWAR
ncbi:MAG: hypothetical protein AB1705_16700 [Verrucomicrobiota bacterium]